MPRNPPIQEGKLEKGKSFLGKVVQGARILARKAGRPFKAEAPDIAFLRAQLLSRGRRLQLNKVALRAWIVHGVSRYKVLRRVPALHGFRTLGMTTPLQTFYNDAFNASRKGNLFPPREARRRASKELLETVLGKNLNEFLGDLEKEFKK